MFRIVPVIALALLSIPAQTAAQPASPYVAREHRSLPFLEHLIRLGVIPDPDPLTRPFTRQQIWQSLEAADTLRASPALRALVRRLRDEFRAPFDNNFYRIDGIAGALAASQARRDPLRAAGADGTNLTGHLGMYGVFGPAVVWGQALYDPSHRRDPDYTGIKDRVIQGRWIGYGAVQFRHGEAFFGDLSRNWGPSFIQGLLVSDAPYSYDHFTGRVGTRAIDVEVLVSTLENVIDPAGNDNNRYYVAHRVTIRPPIPVEISLSEATLLAGPGRTLDFWVLNPFRSAFFSGDGGTYNRINYLLGGDVTARPWRGFAVFVSAMSDDIQYNGPSTNDEPMSYAFSAGAQARLPAGIGLESFYTRVSNLAYRTANPVEIVALRGVGLARNFSDYDQLTARLSFMPLPGLLLEPEGTLLRQGEGDLRLPFPPVEQNATTPIFLAGVVERTLRAGIRVTMYVAPGLYIAADAGVHRIRNAGHVAGATDTRGVAGVAAQFQFGRAFRW